MPKAARWDEVEEVESIIVECWKCAFQFKPVGRIPGGVEVIAKDHARETGHPVDVTKKIRQVKTVRWVEEGQ